MRFLMVCAKTNQVAAAEDYLVKLASASDIDPVSTQVLVGTDPGAVLADFLAGETSTLMVLSSHARRNLAGLLLGKVAAEVLHASPHPVVLVGPRTTVPPRGYRYSEVVVCLDRRESAPDLVDLCARFAGELDLRPQLFRVMPMDADEVDEGAFVSLLADRLIRAGLAPSQQLERGGPANSIVVQAADRPASLLALAATGDKYDNFGVHSVAVAVARQAAIPVLVLGPNYHPEVVPLPPP
jgi:nucleotide-binding universal stress UspA family protein